MRLVLLVALLTAALPAHAAGRSTDPPPSAANLLRLHPGPWRMPGTLAAGMRFEPETGEAVVETGSARALLEGADARARAEAGIVRHADGSRHAVLDGALRRYVVVSVDAQGRLVQDCVPSAAEAERIVREAAARGEK